MKKNNGKINIVKLTVIVVILALMLVGFYFYVSTKMKAPDEETAGTVTVMQRLLLQDLDKAYPPTPKEVVKLYSEITKCFYNEAYTEEELKQLNAQAQKLYDAELLANQPEGDSFLMLQKDIESMKKSNTTISNFAPSSSTDVEYYDQDGYEWAKLYCVYTIRKGTKLSSSNEEFLLRRDEDGHWKIFGWQLAKD